MKNKVLGVCACPLCNFPAQEVRESTAKSPKPYLMCDECGGQIFARQARSVKVLLDRIGQSEKPAAIAVKPAPVAPPPKPAPAPVAPVVAPVVKPAVEQAAPAPKPERTMFDWLTE